MERGTEIVAALPSSEIVEIFSQTAQPGVVLGTIGEAAMTIVGDHLVQTPKETTVLNAENTIDHSTEMLVAETMMYGRGTIRLVEVVLVTVHPRQELFHPSVKIAHIKQSTMYLASH